MFDKGDLVLIFGLKSKASWNGKKATILGPFQWHQGRYPIQIMQTIINNNNDQKNNNETKALIKPSNLKLISKNTSSSNNNDTFYEIKFINNDRGFGMFANCDIPSGTVILKESPIIKLAKDKYRNGKTRQEWIKQQFDLLSNDNKKKVLLLHNNLSNIDKCVGVYRTNAYQLNESVNNESGLFLIISRINHSCFPNSQFIDENGLRGIVTLFGINKGDEITHSYIDNNLFMSNCSERNKYILQNYGFVCQCNECLYFKSRDKYRLKYRNLEKEIEKGFDQINAQKILDDSIKMIDIIKTNFNGYPCLLSQCYMNAAQGAAYLQKYNDVIDFMKRSAKLDIKYYGKECDMTDIQMMKRMLPTKFQNTFCWNHILGDKKLYNKT